MHLDGAIDDEVSFLYALPVRIFASYENIPDPTAGLSRPGIAPNNWLPVFLSQACDCENLL